MPLQAAVTPLRVPIRRRRDGQSFGGGRHLLDRSRPAHDGWTVRAGWERGLTLTAAWIPEDPGLRQGLLGRGAAAQRWPRTVSR
jgi:hypothetical protein